MKLPRFVLSLRALMLVVLLSGLVLAYRVDLGRRRAALQLEIARQFELTDKILDETEIDANTHVSNLNLPGLGLKGMGSRSASSSEIYWERSLQLSYTAGLEKRSVVGLRILGDSWDLRMKFIVVYDLGGELNPKILERLLLAYREKGWAYRVVFDKASFYDGSR